MDRVEPDALLDRVDVDRLITRIDLDALLDRIDPNALLDRIDANALLARVDVDQLLAGVDPNPFLERVDVDTLMERVDVNSLVERTELGAVIARSTTGVFSGLLDVVRAQIVAVDQLAQGIPARVLRGARRELPPAPGGTDDHVDPSSMSTTERAVAVQGRVAGSVSRFLAFLVDQFAIGVLFGLGATLIRRAIEVVTRTTLDADQLDRLQIPVVIAYGLWAFAYTAGSLAAAGQTIGKTLLGLLVVRSDGSRLDPKHAALRTVVFPLSFLLLGIGFLLGLFRHDRRQLHDLIADTAVVYAWDAQTALLRAEAVQAETSLPPE